jgi:hypothetical protein
MWAEIDPPWGRILRAVSRTYAASTNPLRPAAPPDDPPVPARVNVYCRRTVANLTPLLRAEQGDGLVWFYRHDWASPEDGGAIIQRYI